MKRYRPLPTVAYLLLLSALASAAGAAQWRCGADADGVWSCHDVGEQPDTTRTAPGTASRKQKRSPAPQTARPTTPEDDRWKLCPPVPAAIPAAATATDDESPVNFYADTAESVEQQVFTLRGNAVVLYGQQRLDCGQHYLQPE